MGYYYYVRLWILTKYDILTATTVIDSAYIILYGSCYRMIRWRCVARQPMQTLNSMNIQSLCWYYRINSTSILFAYFYIISIVCQRSWFDTYSSFILEVHSTWKRYGYRPYIHLLELTLTKVYNIIGWFI